MCQNFYILSISCSCKYSFSLQYSPNFSHVFFQWNCWDCNWISVFMHMFCEHVYLKERCAWVHKLTYTHTLLTLKCFLWAQQSVFKTLFIPHSSHFKFHISSEITKWMFRWITFLKITKMQIQLSVPLFKLLQMDPYSMYV